MKRILPLLLFTAALVVVVPGSLFAQSSSGFTSYYKPGNVVINADVGGGTYYKSFSLAIYPGVEFLLAKYRVADYLPLDFGVAARGRLGLDSALGGAGLDLGAGGFGTLHVGFRGIPGDVGKILGRFDVFLGLGVVFDFVAPSAYGGLGFGEFSGLNFFLTDNLALRLSDQWWHNYFDYTAGLQLKFGSKAAAKKAL